MTCSGKAASVTCSRAMARANSTTRVRLAWTAPTVGLTHATANLASRIASRVHHGVCTIVQPCTGRRLAGVQAAHGLSEAVGGGAGGLRRNRLHLDRHRRQRLLSPRAGLAAPHERRQPRPPAAAGAAVVRPGRRRAHPLRAAARPRRIDAGRRAVVGALRGDCVQRLRPHQLRHHAGLPIAGGGRGHGLGRGGVALTGAAVWMVRPA